MARMLRKAAFSLLAAALLQGGALAAAAGERARERQQTEELAFAVSGTIDNFAPSRFPGGVLKGMYVAGACGAPPCGLSPYGYPVGGPMGPMHAVVSAPGVYAAPGSGILIAGDGQSDDPVDDIRFTQAKNNMAAAELSVVPIDLRKIDLELDHSDRIKVTWTRAWCMRLDLRPLREAFVLQGALVHGARSRPRGVSALRAAVADAALHVTWVALFRLTAGLCGRRSWARRSTRSARRTGSWRRACERSQRSQIVLVSRVLRVCGACLAFGARAESPVSPSPGRRASKGLQGCRECPACGARWARMARLGMHMCAWCAYATVFLCHLQREISCQRKHARTHARTHAHKLKHAERTPARLFSLSPRLF